MEYLKLSEEVAREITARVKSFDFKTVEKIRKAKDANGTFDVIISTEVKDRAGETVRQAGWDLDNYKNNPIVLWGHDYYSLPIGICTETYQTEFRGVPALGARGVFLPAEVNPLAQQVRRMYEYGVKSGFHVGCTTSVGFIPREFDPEDSTIITRAELLEFSFVDVPANQGVGPAVGRAITFEEAKELGLDMDLMKTKGVTFSETRGYIPKDVSDKKAPEDTPWKKPTLEDFTDKSWDELSDEEKRHIAGHYAWAKENPPATFGDMKLPHHRPSDGAVVWHGVEAAMGALMGARGGVDVDGDKKAVYEHLAAHYREFDKEPPEFKSLKEAQVGDHCEMPDGSPGVLATDPNDPDGPLICVPDNEDKAATEISHKSLKDLTKAIGTEHERHIGEVEDAIDEFCQKAEAMGDGNDNEPDGDEDDKKKARSKKPTRESVMRENLKDIRDSIRDEQAMHRAKSISVFKDFKATDDKAFSIKPHLKTLRQEHDEYEARNNKALDEFEERMTQKGAIDGDRDQHTDWITERMESSARAHKKAINKIAKAMVKEAYGEEDKADEKVLEILQEHLSAYVPEPVQRAVFQKVGARISSATREKLGEAHEHMKAATAIVEALHGGLGNDEGEESRSVSDDTSPAPAPRSQRSRPAESHAEEDLNEFLSSREIVREITTVAQRGLERLNKKAKQ